MSQRTTACPAFERWMRDRSAGIAARFFRDERGTTTIIFSMLFIVILLSIGVALDYSRSTAEQARMQWALDASVLAASAKMGQPDQDTAGPQIANQYLAQNMPPGSTAHIDNLTFNTATGTVSANVSSSVPMSIMKVFGYDSLDVQGHSSVVKGNSTIEVAMVLDNSGSMGSSMPALRSAAKSMTSILYAGSDGTDKVKVALVPFAASVKVGSTYQNSGWIDTGAASSIHSENFNISTQSVVYAESYNVSKTRIQLFGELGIGWAGCVESRPGALDTNDTPPLSSNGNTLFVPMFAPDEPDNDNASAAGYGNYSNSYISDRGGTCPVSAQICLVFNKKKNTCTTYGLAPIDAASAQARTCKYSGATLTGGTGPNFMCTSNPVVALSTNKTSVDNAITALASGGYTNIGEGAMWGWRALSPELPFTEGRPYNDPHNKKIMIVMTDGDNTYPDDSNHDQSWYGASGYASKGRIGTVYNSTGYTQAMDTKLATACANAKAAGITVYTVAFGSGVNVDTKALLTQCASSPSGYFVAADAAALVASFQNIGKEIADLRVSN